MRWKRLRVLVAVQAAIGGALLLALLCAAESSAPEAYDQVAVGFLSDGRLFQLNRDRDRLRVEGETDLPLNAWQALPTSDGFLVLRHDAAEQRYRAVQLSLQGEERAAGPPASVAAFAPSGEAWLAGDGKYLSGPPTNRAVTWGGREERSIDTLFSRPGFRDELVDALAVSPDGRYLAASAWAYNIGSVLVLWDLVERRPIAQTDDHGSQLAFTPDSKTLIAVRSHAAQVRIRTFDTATGTRRASTEILQGSSMALALDAAGRRLAISRAGWGHDNGVELYEVEGLRQISWVRWPDARYAAALRFEEDGLTLAGASGGVWRWTSDGRVAPLRRAWPKPWDLRWILPAVLATLWALLWIPAILTRRSAGAAEGVGPAFGKAALAIVGGAEGLKIGVMMLDPWFIISTTNVTLLGAHLFLAAALILYGLGWWVLKGPIRKGYFIVTGALIGTCAALDLYITAAAIASV